MENKESLCNGCLNKNKCPALPNDKTYKDDPDIVTYCYKFEQIPFDLWNN